MTAGPSRWALGWAILVLWVSTIISITITTRRDERICQAFEIVPAFIIINHRISSSSSSSSRWIHNDRNRMRAYRFTGQLLSWNTFQTQFSGEVPTDDCEEEQQQRRPEPRRVPRLLGVFFSRWRKAASTSSSLLAIPPPAVEPPSALFTQVISDVDDTLKSSGGVQLAGVVALGGIDVQYPRGTMYPGVAEFMLQLSLGPARAAATTAAVSRSIMTPGSGSLSPLGGSKDDDDDDEVMQLSPPLVAILTARAEEFKAALQIKTASSPLAQTFSQAGRAAGYDGWGIGPVLYGSVAEWILQRRKGLRKFTNFERLLQQDPTGAIMQYIYVGDTGELDQEAGETMLREYPQVVKAVFLHVVSDLPLPQSYDMVTIPPPKWIQGRPVLFFRTYVGAAVLAVQCGLMGLQGLESVVAAAQEQLQDEPRVSDKWADLDRDLEQASRLLSRM